MADRDEIDWIERNEPWRLKKDDSDGSKEELAWFLKLVEIKGIGRETAEDIGKMFNNEEDLKNSLNSNKVGLRNDVVEKLKNYYKEVK